MQDICTVRKVIQTTTKLAFCQPELTKSVVFTKRCFSPKITYNMDNLAKKMNFEVQANKEANPDSGIATIEQKTAESGPTAASALVDDVRLMASKEAANSTQMGVGHASDEPDLVLQIQRSEATLQADLHAAAQTAQAEINGEVSNLEVQGLDQAANDNGIESVRMPHDEAEFSQFNRELNDKEAELGRLNSLSASERTREINLKRGILVKEIGLMKKQSERYDLNIDIAHREYQLEPIEKELAEIFQRAKVENDNAFKINKIPDSEQLESMIGILPLEEKVKAQDLIRRRDEMTGDLGAQREKMASLGMQLVALDQLLVKDKNELQSLKQEMDREALVAQKERELSLRKTVAVKVEKSNSSGKVKEGLAGGLGAVGAGVGGSMASLSKIFDWADRGLKWLADSNLTKSVQRVLLFPEKVLDWVSKKMGIEDKSQKD